MAIQQMASRVRKSAASRIGGIWVCFLAIVSLFTVGIFAANTGLAVLEYVALPLLVLPFGGLAFISIVWIRSSMSTIRSNQRQ